MLVEQHVFYAHQVLRITMVRGLTLRGLQAEPPPSDQGVGVGDCGGGVDLRESL